MDCLDYLGNLGGSKSDIAEVHAEWISGLVHCMFGRRILYVLRIRRIRMQRRNCDSNWVNRQCWQIRKGFLSHHTVWITTATVTTQHHPDLDTWVGFAWSSWWQRCMKDLNGGGQGYCLGQNATRKNTNLQIPSFRTAKDFFQLPLQLCSYCCELLELLEYGVGGVGGVPLDIGSQAGTLSTDVILGCLIWCISHRHLSLCTYISCF